MNPCKAFTLSSQASATVQVRQVNCPHRQVRRGPLMWSQCGKNSTPRMLCWPARHRRFRLPLWLWKWGRSLTSLHAGPARCRGRLTSTTNPNTSRRFGDATL